MIKLSQVKVENFRALASASIELAELTPLIGKNNSGKSSIISAIKWALAPTALSASDFHHQDQPVVVTVTLVGVTPAILGELANNHAAQLSGYAADGVLVFRRCQGSPGGGVRGVVLELYHPSTSEWRPNPTGIPQAFASITPDVIHLEAMDDAAEDVSANKNTTTIGKLLSRIIDPLLRNHGTAVSEALATIGDRLGASGIDRAPELNAFDEGTNRHVEKFFPGIRIKAHVPTPDLGTLLKGGTIQVFEGDHKAGRDVASMGHGAQRSIQMALLHRLADAERGSGPDTSFTLLLIDEPELYLHPQAVTCVRDALRILAQTEYQVIFATHSPLMLDDEGLAAAAMLHKDGRTSSIRPSVKSALRSLREDVPSQAELLLSVDNLNVALFADTVVLLEGQTESRCLPDLIGVVAGHSASYLGIGLVIVRGADDVPKARRVLTAMGRPCLIVADLDFAFRGAIKIGFFGEDDAAIRELRQHMASMAAAGTITLGSDGLPTGGTCSAEEAMKRLAEYGPASEALDSILSRGRRAGIWIWPRGAIEPHLGLSGKSETEWRRFRRAIAVRPWQEVVPDPTGVQAFVEWLSTAPPAALSST